MTMRSRFSTWVWVDLRILHQGRQNLDIGVGHEFLPTTGQGVVGFDLARSGVDDGSGVEIIDEVAPYVEALACHRDIVEGIEDHPRRARIEEEISFQSLPSISIRSRRRSRRP